MIKYALMCKADHHFDGWFSSMADYDIQAAQGLIDCPYCGTNDVKKAIMAPRVSTSRKKESVSLARQEDPALARREAMTLMNKAAAEIRETIARDCVDVGDNFADEARAMHYGEKGARPIYGRATDREAKSLQEEGVGIAPLPDILTPKPKAKLN